MITSEFDAKANIWDTEYRIRRAKIIFSEILNNVSLTNKDVILEFGCGTGLIGYNLINITDNITFVDTSEGMLSVIKEKANTFQDKQIKY